MTLLRYGVRLHKNQLQYINTRGNPSEWVRKAIDAQIKKERMKKVE